jgi:hypothetical protein
MLILILIFRGEKEYFSIRAVLSRRDVSGMASYSNGTGHISFISVDPYRITNPLDMESGNNNIKHARQLQYTG